MSNDETRKQQIARRLRVSERVLEQYLQLKRAEVEEESSLEDANVTAAATVEQRREASEKRV